MKIPILIATPHLEWGQQILKELSAYGYDAELVTNGRDCQIRSSKVKFFAVLLDIGIENYSVTEVLKFLKISHPAMRVLLLVKSKKDLDSEQGLANKAYHKLGISDVISGPHTFEKLKSRLIAHHGLGHVSVSPEASLGSHRKIRDTEVSPISVKEFYSENISLFDHFIKLGPNNYKKIINRGETFSPERLKKYVEDGVENFYILSSERMNYINYVNRSLSKNISKESSPSKQILPLKNITMKFMEEVHTHGLNPQLVDEGKLICKNMYELILRDKGLSHALSALEECSPNTQTHSFLVSFFSVYICRQLDWAGRKTVDTIALGALLHDVGLLGLPAHFRNLRVSDMTPEQLELFKTHPAKGVELLQKSPLANEALLQIVSQHHEHLDGSGYPLQISGSRIYPLAKIVALADTFADSMIENKTNPKDTAKIFLKERENLLRFDPLLLKGLVQGIIA